MKHTLLLRVLRHALRIKTLRRWQNVGYTKPSLFRYRNCQEQLLRKKKEEILKSELNKQKEFWPWGRRFVFLVPDTSTTLASRLSLKLCELFGPL